MATYLASDAAADINGQIFVVMGGIISLVNYPAPVRTITKATRWRPEEIAALMNDVTRALSRYFRAVVTPVPVAEDPELLAILDEVIAERLAV